MIEMAMSSRPPSHLLPTYARVDLAFERGEGAWLTATDGERYLDFTSGVAVNALGHAHPHLVAAITERAIGPETAAILIEPIMGEGGVRVVEPEFLRALRQLCDAHELLLIFDEVQTGMGRTGELFAYQRSAVTPDIMALAKALGGGFPLGACLATAEAAKGMTTGTHGSTFGGNPLAMAAAGAVLDVMLADGFLDHVRRVSLVLKQRLAEIKDRYPAVVAEVRGEGLLVGLRTTVPNSELVDALRAEKMITVAAGDNVVRLLPPLIVSESEIAEGVRRLERACARIAEARLAPQKQEAAG